MLSRQVKLPNKLQWQKILDRTWFYTKLLFALGIFCTIGYGWGTYNPNKSAIADVNTELDKFYVNKIKEMDLQEPEFTFNNDTQFVRAMHKCINYINFTTPKHLRVPYEMVIGQAALESGWGKSRFATEGNNLFGIRTWSEEVAHLLPIGIEKWPGWGVKVYETKCDSVKDYMRIINEVFAYAEFREMRGDGETDALVLARTLKRWAAEDHYTDLIEDVIKYNIRGKYDL